jgi:hypothetical protein
MPSTDFEFVVINIAQDVNHLGLVTILRHSFQDDVWGIRNAILYQVDDSPLDTDCIWHGLLTSLSVH